jgi:IS5 family transposase
MNKRTTFTDVEYARRKRNARRETFLETMDALIPWQEIVGIVKPHYFDGKRGRPPRGVEIMPLTRTGGGKRKPRTDSP